MRMSKAIVRTGGAHRVEAPVDSSARVSVFPEGRVSDIGAECILGAEAAADSGLLLDDVQFAHAEAPWALTPAARRTVLRMMVSKIGTLYRFLANGVASATAAFAAARAVCSSMVAPLRRASAVFARYGYGAAAPSTTAALLQREPCMSRTMATSAIGQSNDSFSPCL